MKKHSAANRLNVGKAAMHACYAHVDEMLAAAGAAGTPYSIASTPVGAPPDPGATDDALECAFGVHVTGRMPIEVKGKGYLAMYWVDVARVLDGVPPISSAAASVSSTAQHMFSPHHDALEDSVSPHRRYVEPLRGTVSDGGGGGGGGGGVFALSPLGMAQSANESFRIRDTRSRELGQPKQSTDGEVTPPTRGTAPRRLERMTEDGPDDVTRRETSRRRSAVFANAAWIQSTQELSTAAAAAAAGRGAAIAGPAAAARAGAASTIVRIARAGAPPALPFNVGAQHGHATEPSDLAQVCAAASAPRAAHRHAVECLVLAQAYEPRAPAVTKWTLEFQDQIVEARYELAARMRRQMRGKVGWWRARRFANTEPLTNFKPVVIAVNAASLLCFVLMRSVNVRMPAPAWLARCAFTTRLFWGRGTVGAGSFCEPRRLCPRWSLCSCITNCAYASNRVAQLSSDLDRDVLSARDALRNMTRTLTLRAAGADGCGCAGTCNSGSSL